MRIFSADAKDQIISKGLLVSSNSPKKRTNKFIFTNSIIQFLREFEDTIESFWNYLTFKNVHIFFALSSNADSDRIEKCNCRTDPAPYQDESSAKFEFLTIFLFSLPNGHLEGTNIITCFYFSKNVLLCF